MQVTGSKALNTYRLSIRAYAGGFSFSVVSLLDNSVMRDEDVCVNPGEDAAEVLDQILHRPRLTHYNYSSICLEVDTPSTIVPLEVFRKDDVYALYKLNFPDAEVRRDDVRYQMLTSVEAVLIFVLRGDVFNVVADMYPGVEVVSTIGECIEASYAIHRRRTTTRKDFYAYVRDQQMVLCVLWQGKLHFACTYEATDDANLLYHLLAVWKTLDMSFEDDACAIDGASDLLVEDIQRYIKTVVPCA
ncbi:MAG: DUF3822 family protein [Bacteroidaceae bacterium]|nr:DUF3822 family protein [Bacteroidaceae bacterium]